MVKPFELPEVPTGLINVTDHDSRVVRTQGQPGMQGYNAQLAVNDRQIIVAAEITTESPDFGHLEPMVRATQRELAANGLGDPDVVLADAGYWHQRQMQQIASEGIRCSSRPTPGCAKARGRAGPAACTRFMRRVLATPARPRPLPPTPDHHRARVRPDQVQPRDQTLPTPRQNRLPQRMATDRRQPQPAQAPQPPTRRRDTLSGGAAAAGADLTHADHEPRRRTRRCATAAFPTASIAPQCLPSFRLGGPGGRRFKSCLPDSNPSC